MEEKRRTWAKIAGKFFAIAFFAFAFFVCRYHVAEAASLYFSPASGSYASGGTITVGVYTSTSDAAANAFSGTVSFPTDLLEATSVSKSGSVMSLWVSEPTYSNSSGTVQFDGIVLNPGYTGSSGKIATITFKVKGTGTASLRFSSGAILANDGLGTNIYTGGGTASYTLGQATETPKPAEPVSTTPGAPTVSSSTHPDSNSWYSANDVTFSWPLPASVTGVNVLADHEPTTDPGTRSDGVMSKYTYTDVDDGVWYFHIRLQNEKGWGAVSHFKFQIDTVAPTAFLVSANEKAEVTFTNTSTDALSGVKEYQFIVDGVVIDTVPAGDVSAGFIHDLAGLPVGKQTLTVRALDYAGNMVAAPDVTFTVTEAPPEPVPEQVVQVSPYAPRIVWGVAVVALLLVGVVLLLALLYVLLSVLRHVRFHWEATPKPRKTKQAALADKQSLREMKALRKELLDVTERLEKLESKISRP